uniref:Uncharacterized protein n=1 Tax=Leviviridae sp. TaxID=2027243 RepID=A0A514D761_9VIRU|nr:MAG: hypothetical protein H1Bulk29281e3660_000002 [Leviviridae sp.]
MLTDPQSITVNGSGISLPAISRGDNTSTYQSADGLMKLTVSHQYGRRKRTLIRFDQTKTAADPLVSTVNNVYSESVQVVIDRPLAGFTTAESNFLLQGVAGVLTASSGNLAASILGGQN